MPSVDFAMGSQHFIKVINDLEETRARIESEHAIHTQEHEAKMREMDIAITYAKSVQDGDKGDAGDVGPMPEAGVHYAFPKDGVSPDPDAIAEAVIKRIKQPRDGKDAVVDHAKIAQMAAKLIPIPRNGKDAISPTVDDILEAVKEKITLEHIPGLKGEMDSYRSQLAGKVYGRDTSIRGGGDTVAAGSGVTITQSNGVKTISSSGVAGFTTLVATETPDGTILVFTFAAATAKPSFIILDGVWTQDTGKNGTVNWTWNNGTKKATVAIAPLSDILGVV
jgi:hypothetical protein